MLLQQLEVCKLPVRHTSAFCLQFPELFTALVTFLYTSIFILFRKRKGRRKGNINVWLPLMHPLLGTWLTTQTCSDWEIKLVTLGFTGQCSVH